MQAIVNVDENWGIGKDGDQPFYIPEDLRFFKEKTLGKVVVMGRATLMALPGSAPLKNRMNVVLTRQSDFSVEGAVVCRSSEEADAFLASFADEDVFVIGGAEIYQTLLGRCSKAYVTKIFAKGDCDKFFPNLDEADDWKLIKTSEVKNHEGLKFCFCEYERK